MTWLLRLGFAAVGAGAASLTLYELLAWRWRRAPTITELASSRGHWPALGTLAGAGGAVVVGVHFILNRQVRDAAVA